MTDTQTPTVIAGTRPTGSTPADGTVRWATRSFSDGRWTFTTFDGWLISTDNVALAESIEQLIIRGAIV